MRMNDGSVVQQDSSLWGMFKAGARRVLTNESLFLTWFTNNASVPRYMGVAAPSMGTIVPIALHDLPGSTIFAQARAFICSSKGVHLTIAFTKTFGAGLFGGEGFILQQLTADQEDPGELFIHGGGTIVKKDLNNEELALDPGSLMAFTNGIQYDFEQPGWANAFIGGQFFLAKLKGTGSVWIQSTPTNKIIDLIVAKVPQKSDN